MSVKKENSFPTSSGIYSIVCLTNGRVYIGQSSNIRRRIQKHLSDLNRNEHSNPMLQSCWNHDGSSSFSFKIIELVKGELNHIELHYIEKYQSWANKRGFNMQHPLTCNKLIEKRKPVKGKKRYFCREGYLTLKEAAKISGIKYDTLHHRVMKLGLNLDHAMYDKIGMAKQHTIGSRTGSVRELAETHNIKYASVKSRLQIGWTLEEALAKPLR